MGCAMATMVTVIRIKAFTALIVNRVNNIDNQWRTCIQPDILYV
jgi:hypothetical protein